MLMSLIKMVQKLTNKELKKIYQIIKAFDEGLIVNPSEDWELDYYDETLVDKKGMKSILNKIEKLLPKKELKQTNKNVLRRKYHHFNNQINEAVYRKIEKAFNNRKTIEIEYFSMSAGETEKRPIDIYHKTRKYITAYCHLRKAMRTFRTSRIVSAKLTNNSYVIPDNFDKN